MRILKILKINFQNRPKGNENMKRKVKSLGWGVRKEGRNIWTRNAVKGVSVRKERRKRDGRNEWRLWDATKSKIAASIIRTKYGKYPEYHTSLDDLNLVTPIGLQGGYYVIRKAIEIIKNDFVPDSMTPCESQIGKRYLYPNLSTKKTNNEVRDMINLISYCEGQHILLEIRK